MSERGAVLLAADTIGVLSSLALAAALTAFALVVADWWWRKR